MSAPTVFRSMQPIQPSDVLRGQYIGSLDEPGVAHDSQTQTFVALTCFSQIHQLIAPSTWRLPFERVWRETKP